MCHFEYTLHGCGHKGETSAVICRHMGEKVKPKVDFTTMLFVKMVTCLSHHSTPFLGFRYFALAGSESALNTGARKTRASTRRTIRPAMSV
ncbi:hypothetical protein IFR04_004022 [Cadophora malorum]|uniref:Uncharacterized protein n=1 Tax=Cadophora malorum TaxID=108018 RepID=A0A8H7WDH6_9HELO|nr:hypothetical protein IFR04_004022 [Cadophora malorum]